jgi:alpha-ketoglutarate-dependent taurine dioxygenase
MTNAIDATSVLGGVPESVERNQHTAIRVLPIGNHTADPNSWVQAHQAELRQGLNEHGAYLLRGFPVDIDNFRQIVNIVGGNPLEYTERSTPRTALSGNIYTSTDYPADQSIPMHNENSYSHHWPELLFFFCYTAAESGGATPVADSRAVLRGLSTQTRDLFAGGVSYTRTFREGLGLSWQESFQTDDPAVVAEYCRRHGHEYEWIDDGLRTRHHRPAFAREPHTGESVWFNQANLFHVSSLEPEVREAILELYSEKDLPRNAYLGDGSPIPTEVIEEIDAVYADTSLALPWQAGDIMVINNMLMAHGRQPYSGARRILVAMS